MKKLKDIKDYVTLTLGKLSGIRVDPTRLDGDAQRETPKLLEILRKILKGKICSEQEIKIKKPYISVSIVKNLIINLVNAS